jgi:hypothetical protein
MKTTDEDIRCIKEEQLAAVGIQDKMPMKVRGWLMKLKLRAIVVVR